MGCKNTNTNNELFNEDVDIKRKVLTGVHFSKGAEGIEGNIQIALATTRKKKYEIVNQTQATLLTRVEETEGNLQVTSEST